MNGQWMKKRDWKISHYVQDGERTVWMNHEAGQTACGSRVTINKHLEPEPTGIDTARRCGRCKRVLNLLRQSGLLEKTCGE